MKRILTALVLLPLVLYVVIWGPLWSFFAVLTSVALICYYEYAGIAAAYGFGRGAMLPVAMSVSQEARPRAGASQR